MQQYPKQSYLVISLIGLSLTTTSSADLWVNEKLPMVLTPARLKQNRSEVPASVSVIDRAMISASGLREIPELFRLIPGTSVGARDGWNYVVSYHGTNYRDSRRMQVLIDGRSIYQAGLATVDWNDIPITIEDIERIEIVRGPATATYGANAYLGVINIITRHPVDTNNMEFRIQRGSQNTEDYRIAKAGELLGGFYRVSLASRHDDGFDINKENQERLDSKSVQLFNTRYEKQLDEVELSIGLGYKRGRVTDDIADIDITPSNTYIEDYYFSTKLKKEISNNHQLAIQYDYSAQEQQHGWTAGLPPQFISLNNHPSAIVYGDINEDLRDARHDIDVQDTYVWNKNITTVAGVHLKQSRVSSETYYGRKLSNNHYQIFANIEKNLSEKYTLNTGGSYEYEENLGKNFSSRISLHYHIANNQSFRAIYSEAIRTPNLMETSANWSYTARNVRPEEAGMTEGVFIINAQGNLDVKPELIKSREIGYYGNFNKINLQWDVKLFSDQLDQLISNSIALERFDPKNEYYVTQKGIEAEIDFRPSHKWLIHSSLAYIKDESDTDTETTFTPKYSASGLLSYTNDLQWRFSAAQYYALEIGTSKNKFNRSDVNVTKTYTYQKTEFELNYKIQYRHDNDSELLSDNIYRSKFRHFFGISLKY
jgi:iron complex outermembrane receptor protein